MSAFDLTLRVVSADVIPVSENENGEANALHLIFLTAVILPFSGPDGPIVAPIGTLRIPINKSAAQSLGKDIIDAAEQLIERPHIDIATSLAGVDAAARAAEQIRGH